jgi:hypothetical protein
MSTLLRPFFPLLLLCGTLSAAWHKAPWDNRSYFHCVSDLESSLPKQSRNTIEKISPLPAHLFMA